MAWPRLTSACRQARRQQVDLVVTPIGPFVEAMPFKGGIECLLTTFQPPFMSLPDPPSMDDQPSRSA